MADEITIRRRIKAKMPGFELDQKLHKEIAEIAEGSIIENILLQRQANGSSLKVNAHSTRRRKERQGNNPILSLVDKEHRFIKGRSQSWAQSVRGVGSMASLVIYPATGMLRKLNRYVQGKGYTGWFGISKDSSDLIRHAIRKWIRREVSKAIRKQGVRVA